jgi:hypothetical protein
MVILHLKIRRFKAENIWSIPFHDDDEALNAKICSRTALNWAAADLGGFGRGISAGKGS